MNSINQQQIEENHQDLAGKEAIEKLKELVEKPSTCFFCSNIKTGIPFSTRPMTVQKVDEEGNLWFLSSNDSNTHSELQQDPFVQLL
ncbi:MAG TPA: pyridoxamine 5'-phosphate oxidase family protein, partial [Mucilaginibacter sp.]